MKFLKIKEILNMRIENERFNRSFSKDEWMLKFPDEKFINRNEIFHFMIFPDGLDSFLAASDDESLVLLAYTLVLKSDHELRKAVQVCLFENYKLGGVSVTGIGFIPYGEKDKARLKYLSSTTRSIMKTVAKGLDKTSFHKLKSELESLGKKALIDGVRKFR